MKTLIFTLFNIFYVSHSVFLYHIVFSTKYYDPYIDKITIACSWVIWGILADYLLFEYRKTEESIWTFISKMMVLQIIIFDVNILYIMLK